MGSPSQFTNIRARSSRSAAARRRGHPFSKSRDWASAGTARCQRDGAGNDEKKRLEAVVSVERVADPERASGRGQDEACHDQAERRVVDADLEIARDEVGDRSLSAPTDRPIRNMAEAMTV